MKTLKRSVAVLLSILMLISVFSATAMTASASSTTVYFVNTNAWAEVYAHVWVEGGGNVTGEWPGQPATVVDAEKGVYSYDLGEGNRIIFNNNNNGAETATINMENTAGKYYEPKTATVYDTADAAIAAANGGTVVTNPYDYYVVGTLAGNNWTLADANCGMTKNDDGSYTKTFTGVAAGSYEFKINTGKWANDGGEEYPSENYFLTVDADNSTVVITLAADKNISVNVVGADPQESSVTPVADGYCLIGSINGDNNVGDGETTHADIVNQFTKDASGYKLSMTITEDSHVYIKDTTCTKWYMTAGWLGNNVGTATLYETNTNMPSLPEGEFPNKLHVPAGDYTFTLVENADGTLTLSYTDEVVTKPTDPSESTVPTTPSTPENPAVYPVPVDAKAEDTVTVKFTLQAAEKCVNGEGGLTYDSTVLQLETFEFLNVTGSYQNTELHNEVLFNFTDAQNPADFTTAKDFVVVTFKAIKDGTTNVTLNLVELNATGDKDIPLVTDGNVVGEFALTADSSVVAPTVPTEPSSETDPTKPTDPIPAPKLTVKKKLNAGATTTAKVTNAGGKKVTYTSTNTKVATVNKNTGKITALAKGKATIKAKVGNVTLKKVVKVKNDPTLKNGKKKVKNNQTIKINKGKTLTLKVVGKASTIKNKVKTSKKNVGKITSKAKQAKVTFKAKKKGTTTLTITINNVKTYKVKVKVK